MSSSILWLGKVRDRNVLATTVLEIDFALFK